MSIAAPFKSKWLRLTVYSFFSGHYILTKLALLSKNERELICNSKLLESKNLQLPIKFMISKYHLASQNPWSSLPDDHFLFKALTRLRYQVCFTCDTSGDQGKKIERLSFKVPPGLNEDCLDLTLENKTPENLSSAVE